MINKNIHTSRIKALQQNLVNNGIDAAVLIDRENLNYFGGIEQVECLAIVVPAAGVPVGITLPPDITFVENNSVIEDIRGYRFPQESLGTGIINVLEERGGKNPIIGFERYFISFGLFDGLRKVYDPHKFCDLSAIIYKMRSVKIPEEILLIKKAANAACVGLAAAVGLLKPGVTELELAAEAEYASMKAGSQGTPFRPQVVSGERVMTTHPFASKRVIRDGEIVILHLGARCGGYVGKICRTAVIGEIPAEQEKLYKAVLAARKVVIDKLYPGHLAEEAALAAIESVGKSGYGKAIMPIAGHGMGLRQSEFYPVLAVGNKTVLEANMVVDALLPTIYGKFGGPRITDTIHITENGPEILTVYPDGLIRK